MILGLLYSYHIHVFVLNIAVAKKLQFIGDARRYMLNILVSSPLLLTAEVYT